MLKVTSDFYVADAPLAGGQKNEAVKKTTMSNIGKMEAALNLYLQFVTNNYEKLQQVRAVFTKLLLQAVGEARDEGVRAQLQQLYDEAVARDAEMRLVDAAQWSAFEDFARRPSAAGNADKLAKSLKAANELVWDQFAKLQAAQAYNLTQLEKVDRLLGTNLVSQESEYQARRADMDEQQWAALEAEVKRLVGGVTLRGGCDCADAVLGATA